MPQDPSCPRCERIREKLSNALACWREGTINRMEFQSLVLCAIEDLAPGEQLPGMITIKSTC